MPALIRRAVAACATLLLAGCGGGGGGGGDDFAGSAAQGLYAGTTDDGRVLTGFIFSGGAMWILYSDQADDGTIAGFVRADTTAVNGELDIANGRDYNLQGSGVTPFTGSGTYSTRDRIEGSLAFASGGGLGIIGDYDDAYESTPEIDTIEGGYSGVIAGPSGSDQVQFTIDDEGGLSGASLNFPCPFAGQAIPRADGNAYDLQITFGSGAACPFDGLVVEGIVAFNASIDQLLGAVTLTDRSDGMLFVGNQVGG